MSFIAELKRRRVFRVAGAYLVAAWVVLQVVATLLPAFDLPSWTLKSVAILAIIGFPIALALGWIFDITTDGIERTDPTVRFRFPLRAAIGGTLIVLIGVVGFLTVRRRLSAAGIDDNAVVIIPFRVSGSDKLASMREGMVDLMSPKLTGQGGPRAVDSRTALSAWRRAVRSEKDDMEPRQAIKLARKLGAGHVILGEVVGAVDEIAFNARVYSTIDGVASDPASVRAKPDSVLNAVDALVAELLSRKAGEKDKLAALMTESLPAVQAYLDGQRNYRLGKYKDAVRNYATASDIDTTFALAAYGEYNALGWANPLTPRRQRALNLAFAFRDRLPPYEKASLIGFVGEEYPKGSTRRAGIERLESVVARYPDAADALYELGDIYYHFGPPSGMEDAEDRALDAWNRAIALDSSFAGPWEHQMEIHARRGDTAQVRKVFTKLRELKSDRVETTVGWLYAGVTNDDTMRTRLLKAVPEWTGTELWNAILLTSLTGTSTSGLDELAEKMYNGPAVRRENGVFRKKHGATYSLERGRPQRALKYLSDAFATDRNEARHQTALVEYAIIYPHFFADSAERVIKNVRSVKNPEAACVAALWDAQHGRAADAGQSTLVAPYCAQLARAALANTRVELMRADSTLVNESSDTQASANYTAVVLARLFARVGDTESARRAAQRSDANAAFRMPQQLELARAAARAGRREQAIRSYRIYLSYQDPEPGLATEMRDKVRAELATLVSR